MAAGRRGAAGNRWVQGAITPSAQLPSKGGTTGSPGRRLARCGACRRVKNDRPGHFAYKPRSGLAAAWTVWWPPRSSKALRRPGRYGFQAPARTFTGKPPGSRSTPPGSAANAARTPPAAGWPDLAELAGFIVAAGW